MCSAQSSAAGVRHRAHGWSRPILSSHSLQTNRQQQTRRRGNTFTSKSSKQIGHRDDVGSGSGFASRRARAASCSAAMRGLGLVGVGARRGAVDDLARRRRRARRGGALVSDLLARRTMAPVSPVDSLAFSRTILRRPARAVQQGLRARPADGAGQAHAQGFGPGLLRFIFAPLLLPVLLLRRRVRIA